MNNSLAKLLAYIEPKIANIGENRVEIKSLSEVLKTITEIVELGKKSYLEILDYYDQDFIIRCLKIYNETNDDLISKYKSCKYLLENQDNNMKELPQYQDAIKYMDFLINYLNELWQKVTEEYNLKSDNLKNQELLNKYYLILKSDNVFIKDALEFIDFLNKVEFTLEERYEILLYVNRCNIKNYSMNTDSKDMFVNDINFAEVKALLEKNAYLIDKNMNLNFKEENIIQDGKINQEYIFNKKKYLLNKIYQLFETFEYDEITKYYKEYKTLDDYEEEFKKQDVSFELNRDKKLIFVMENGKSLVRKYLEECNPIYQGPIYKNLLDIESDKEYKIPDYYYNDTYLYIKPEFVVKTVYTYLKNGYVLVLGVIDRKTPLKTYLYKNRDILEILREKDNLEINDSERDLLLKDLKIDDLVMTIDLNTLDVKMEEENAR